MIKLIDQIIGFLKKENNIESFGKIINTNFRKDWFCTVEFHETGMNLNFIYVGGHFREKIVLFINYDQTIGRNWKLYLIDYITAYLIEVEERIAKEQINERKRK